MRNLFPASMVKFEIDWALLGATNNSHLAAPLMVQENPYAHSP